MIESPPPFRLRCAACQHIDATIVETIALCPACRSKFTKFNLPRWLKLVFGVLILIVLCNLVGAPFSVSAIVASAKQDSEIAARGNGPHHLPNGGGP
jgi:hypothetical protein